MVQNYNRYSYVLNNPTKYTDPSGYVYSNYDLQQKIQQELYQTINQELQFSMEENYERAKQQVESQMEHGGGSESGGGYQEYIEGANDPVDPISRPLSAQEKAQLNYSLGMGSSFQTVRSGAPKGSSGRDVLGLAISSLDVGLGTYVSHMYNHNTYKTTTGVVKDIFTVSGKVRSKQALKFLEYSKYLKGIAFKASLLSTAYAGYKIANGKGNGMDKLDFGVGVFGLASGAAVAAGLISNPVGWAIGIGAGVYFGARFIYDLNE